MEFMELIESLQTNPKVDYEVIGNDVQEIVSIHEKMEKRIYDLEHDVKVRDDSIEDMKKENFSLSQKITSQKEKEEDEAEEEKISIDDIMKDEE